MHTTRLVGAAVGVALLGLTFRSTASATPVGQGPPAPTLTSDDVPPGYDEVFLSLAEVPMGPIVGEVILDSFQRRAPGPGPEIILSVGVRAAEFASLLPAPSAQRVMLDAAADGWLRAADSFAGMRDSIVAGRAQPTETRRSPREAARPPNVSPGAWILMDHYDYQRGAQAGDGAIAMLGRGDIIGFLVVESPDGRADEAMGQYVPILDARILQATAPIP
jgi:hypothetical protein